MLKKFIKRVTPSASQIRNNRFLKRFGKYLNAEHLWHINRNQVALSLSIGVFIAFIPLPGHMIVAALLAILLRANLPVAIASVWVSNPFTMLPMYGFGYFLGAHILGISMEEIQFNTWKVILDFWQPLFLGCVILGAVTALMANILLRMVWMYSVNRRWQKRLLSRTFEESI